MLALCPWMGLTCNCKTNQLRTSHNYVMKRALVLQQVGRPLVTT